MHCPYCGYPESRVIDSRDVDDGIRRRRSCLSCGRRFTTYERVQRASLLVIKKDGRREEFNREKLLNGIRKACEKRPLAGEVLERLVDEIETDLYQLGQVEIPSRIIGDMAMARLKRLDHIAYIRFASVYREFADITMLKEEVDSLLNKGGEVLPDQLPLFPPDDGAGRGRKLGTVP
ncbi:MAG: transcriptional regulator NrdR [Dehalococcoidales bacterium]|nr:transcriptional regulator NrdR [Dehalococcoidales bacterium]